MFLLRSLVSQDRVRFKQGEYDLDLSYITPRIIAMGFPASGLEGTYRNDIDDVSAMMKKYHPGKYMIWNLSNRPYDYTLFEDQVMDFGFPDHHAPPLNLLFKIMLSLYNWIKADPKNVAAVHCLAGKGRTGTIIACYLLLTGLVDEPSQALEYFASKRSEKAVGVTQPGQRSAVEYFTKILQKNIVPYQVPYCLSKIVMYGVDQQQNIFHPVIRVYDARNFPKKLIYATDTPEEMNNNFKRWSNDDMPDNAIRWDFPKDKMTVKGDVLIKVYHMPPVGKKIYMFRLSFHTAFLDGGYLSLTEADLSVEKKFASYRRNGFYMHLFFEKLESTPADARDAENETMEMYCKMFQKIYAERLECKLDTIEPLPPKPQPSPTTSTTKSPTNAASNFFSKLTLGSPPTNNNSSTPPPLPPKPINLDTKSPERAHQTEAVTEQSSEPTKLKAETSTVEVTKEVEPKQNSEALNSTSVS